MSSAFVRFNLPPKRPRTLRSASFLCSATSRSSSQHYLQSIQSKVESHLLTTEQTSLLEPPVRTHPPPALPVQLDLLNYHARIFSRRRPTRPAALRFYRRCIKLDSADGRAWLGLARIHIAEGDIESARRTFRAGTNASRKNPHLLQAWGVLEEKQGCWQRAKALYEAAIRADERHCASWVALGMWYRKYEKDTTKARQMFKRGSEADPRNYYVWHVWGTLEKECRRFKIARECFRRGVESNPNNAATYVIWGGLEDMLGNVNKAVALFERARIANPRNTHTYVSHALALEKLGNPEKAIELLQTAIEIRPHDAAPRQMLGLIESRRGNVERAREYFQESLKVNERHGPTWHAWAQMEQNLGLLDRARELYQESVWAAPRAPHVVRTWHSWAMLELEQGQVDVARRYFAHGLEVDGCNVALLSGLATLEAKAGNMGRSRDCLEKCIRLMPDLRSTWKLYEGLERKYGSMQRAQLVFERCVVTSQQVDQRLIVSEPLPGDYKAGGMWFDALELKPTDSAFELVSKSGGKIDDMVRPFEVDRHKKDVQKQEDER